MTHDIAAKNNCFASSRNNENIESFAATGRLIKCIFMHSARTRCSGSARVRRCFTSNIFIGLSARIPASSMTQRTDVLVIPIGKSFAAQSLARGRDLKIDREINRAILTSPPSNPFLSHPLSLSLSSFLVFSARLCDSVSPVPRGEHLKRIRIAAFVSASIIHTRGLAFE